MTPILTILTDKRNARYGFHGSGMILQNPNKNSYLRKLGTTKWQRATALI
jgi:hypothetical protein